MEPRPICYYCNKNISEPKYIHKETIYSKLDSKYGIGLTGLKKTTRYYEREVAISRCGSCHSEHKASLKPALRLSLVALILSGTVTYYFAKRWYVALIVGIIAAFVAMVLYFMLVYRKRLKELGIKDEGATNDHPAIKELIDNGWQTYKP